MFEKEEYVFLRVIQDRSLSPQEYEGIYDELKNVREFEGIGFSTANPLFYPPALCTHKQSKVDDRGEPITELITSAPFIVEVSPYQRLQCAVFIMNNRIKEYSAFKRNALIFERNQTAKKSLLQS